MVLLIMLIVAVTRLTESKDYGTPACDHPNELILV